MNDPKGVPPGRPRQNDELVAPATQIVGSRADYLGEGQSDVGQRIADDKLELFVTNDPAQAMLQEFARATPDFIALHDVGASSSLRLLTSVATALKTKLQQLSIRRQGQGVPLATLRFVEIPGRGSQKLRVYSTDVDADSQARRQLAHVLLGHSRLGVLIVGDLPGHALATALTPLREAVQKGPWPNRHLMMVPLGASAPLATQATALAGATGISVRVTPQAAHLNDTWGFVTGAWNRLRDGGSSAAPAPAGPAPARRTTDTGLRPMPATTPSAPGAGTPAGPWSDYLKSCASIKGLISACVFDLRTGRELAHLGARPDPEHLIAQGTALYNAMAESGRALGLGASQPDAMISLTAHHLVLHPLPGHPGIVMHAVLDGSGANLTLARMQLQRVDATILGAPARH